MKSVAVSKKHKHRTPNIEVGNAFKITILPAFFWTTAYTQNTERKKARIRKFHYPDLRRLTEELIDRAPAAAGAR